MMETLESLGEDAAVARLCALLPGGVELVTGPGDDCAVLRGGDLGVWRLLKTDCVVEGVHFLAETEPERVGWKAAARAVSDFAAMGGGQPREALITLVAPPRRSFAWAEGVYRGLVRCAKRFGFAIVGGETSRPPLGCEVVMLSVSLSGTIPERACRMRSGARPGDGIWVTGTLGGTLRSGKHLDFVPRLEEARWLVEHLPVTAMMDLSDGIARDLPRLAACSGVGVRLIEENVPLNLGVDLAEGLTGGEDYELLLTLKSEPSTERLAAWAAAFPEVRLTKIGEVMPDGGGESRFSGGWDAFRSPREEHQEEGDGADR